MYKLYNIGVTGKMWSVINDCHIDTMSSVVVNQCHSDFSPVLQGVRQCGVLSGLLFFSCITRCKVGRDIVWFTVFNIYK